MKKLLASLIFAFSCTAHNPHDLQANQWYFEEQDEVVFFHPSEKELDSLRAVDPNTFELQADYDFYASHVIQSLVETNLRVSKSDKRFFVMEDTVIDKQALDIHWGIILKRNNSCLVKTGVWTDLDYLALIDDYYGLEKNP